MIVDWRGFYGSSDAAIDAPNYGEDGYDCVEWIAQQGWSNAKIGMWGISAVGAVQYQTAKEHPPHLVCGVPIVANYKQQYQRYYRGGVLRKTYLKILEMLDYKAEPILAHPIYDAFWKYAELVTTYPQEIDVPMLLMAGWYDHHSYSDGIFCIFNELRSLGGINGREHHKLIIGPWHHNHIGEAVQGQLEYPNAAGVSETEALNFFDYWLRNVPNSYDNLPVVRYYQMGTDEWLNNESYPLDNVTPTFFFLHPAGVLYESNPVDICPPDSFYYDPRNPSSTIGGIEIGYFLLHGPYDQRWFVESRDDVVVFSTKVLDKDLVVAGEVKVQLYVSSNCLDTDFSVRLCDVYPDGRSMLVMDGIRRMRFRNSFETEKLMTPGEIYQLNIKLPHSALTFLRGHQVRLCVSSSNYPRFDINLNNGGSLYTPGDTLIALNRIYHDVNFPSALILPVKNLTGVKQKRKKCEVQNFKLLNYPNPFNSATQINYQLPANAKITLKIYDVRGREIRTLVRGNQSAGYFSVVWDGKNNPGQCCQFGCLFLSVRIE